MNYKLQAKDSRMLAWATEIKIRAERKAGEMLRDREMNTGAKGIGKSAVTTENHTPTLSDIGVSKRQSSNWQKIADIPEAEFEKDIAEAKEKTAILTTSHMVKKVRDEEGPGKSSSFVALDFVEKQHEVRDEEGHRTAQE